MVLFSQLKNDKKFLAYWTAQTISQLANSVHILALPIWIYLMTNSSTAMGFIVFLETIPIIVLSPFAGVLADRLNRKVMLLLCDICRGLLVLSLLTIDSVNQMWYVYIEAVLFGAMSSLFFPTQMSVIQTLFKKDQLSAVNSLVQLSFSWSLFIGPIFGGSIIAFMGVESTFLLNGVSFFIGACGTLLLGITTQNSSKKFKDIHFISDIIEGFKIVIKKMDISIGFITQLCVFLCTGVNSVLFVFYLQNNGASAQVIASFMSFQGLGMIVGAICLPYLDKKIQNDLKLNLYALVVMGVSLVVFIQSAIYYYFLGVISIFLFGLSLSVNSLSIRQLIQRNTPSEATGRVFGLSRVVNQSASALSILIGSILATWINAQRIITICGIVILCFCSFMWYLNIKFKSQKNEL